MVSYAADTRSLRVNSIDTAGKARLALAVDSLDLDPGVNPRDLTVLARGDDAYVSFNEGEGGSATSTFNLIHVDMKSGRGTQMLRQPQRRGKVLAIASQRRVIWATDIELSPVSSRRRATRCPPGAWMRRPRP